MDYILFSGWWVEHLSLSKMWCSRFWRELAQNALKVAYSWCEYSPLPAEPSTEFLSLCSSTPFACYWYSVKNRIGPNSENLHESGYIYIHTHTRNNLGGLCFFKGTCIFIISSPLSFRISVVGGIWRKVDIHILKKKIPQIRFSAGYHLQIIDLIQGSLICDMNQ